MSELIKNSNPYTNMDFVDLGLSVKWASCNLGATKPEEVGDYYAWGEIETKSVFSWETYKYSKGSGRLITKYCDLRGHGYNGFADGLDNLELDDDVAHVKLKGNWRMPTLSEIKELLRSCTWKPITVKGVNGYRVSGMKEGFADHNIFLPATGYIDNDVVNNPVWLGAYWSSSVVKDYPIGAHFLYLNDEFKGYSEYYRRCGQAIRPVCS